MSYICIMFQTLRCVALRTIKYDDRRSIVTAWSDELGRVSLLVPAGASREARRRRAIMMPLGLFTGEADVRPGRDILSIRDVRPLEITPTLSADPSKAVVVMFLTEVLERLLRATGPDRALSAFIFDSVRALDSITRPRGVANFPVVFLYRMGHFLGIEPDASDWRPGRLLDLLEGVYRDTPPVHGRYLEAAPSRVAAMLARLDYGRASRLGLPLELRREILKTLIIYYGLHHASLDGLNSLDVAADIFS